MRLLLDLGDGGGLVDYSHALVAPAPRSNVLKNVEGLSITRERGGYARCTGTLDAGTANLPRPGAGCRVQVRSETGTVLFSGVMPAEPQRVATVTPQSLLVRFVSLEDAWLANGVTDADLQPATGAVHTLSLAENAVALAENTALTQGADDITVAGASEAAAFVTELYQGDGTTAVFALTGKPFTPAGAQTLLDDAFVAPMFRADLWRFVDPGSRLTLGSGGLKLGGGNGLDGQAVMAAQAPVELGGAVYAQMSGVLLQPGSAGILLGLYGNNTNRATCFAGFAVDGTAGAQTLVALVNGAEQGTRLTWKAGHSYTLRLRLYAAEVQRVRETYQAVINGAVQTWGGSLVDAPMQLVFEVVDEGLASSTPATVLYAGAVATSIASAVFAPVNSLSLLGSIAAVSLRRQGSVWVTSTLADGTTVARRPGALDTGEDFAMQSGAISFFSGRVPAVGERVAVRYRLAQRSLARLQSADALAQASDLGLPGLRQKLCRVTGAEPRSSADCAAAAAALLAFYRSPVFGVAGSCAMSNAVHKADVMPGDRVLLPLAGAAISVPVNRVTIEDAHAVPEVLRYGVAFAQTETNGLSFQINDGLPADAVQPSLTYAESTTASLSALTVTMASATTLQVDAGTTPPVGGGFEVRRHDGGWGPDVPGAAADAELVLRSPVRSFSVPRLQFEERFYVRMYDGAETPVYSAKASLVVTHLPVN